MGPIEVLWAILIVVFILIGLVRGFLKELGVTTILIVLLFGFDRLIPILEGFVNNGGLIAIGIQPLSADTNALRPATASETTLWLILTLITVAVVFMAYQGETLSYEGSNPGFPVGTLLSALVGFVNGYLVTGTLWWILDRYHYPVQAIGFQLPLTNLASTIVHNGLLPLDLLGAGVTPDQTIASYGVLPLILVVLIILKVVR
jgi:hypothetical protein